MIKVVFYSQGYGKRIADFWVDLRDLDLPYRDKSTQK